MWTVMVWWGLCSLAFMEFWGILGLFCWLAKIRRERDYLASLNIERRLGSSYEMQQAWQSKPEPILPRFIKKIPVYAADSGKTGIFCLGYGAHLPMKVVGEGYRVHLEKYHPVTPASNA